MKKPILDDLLVEDCGVFHYINSAEKLPFVTTDEVDTLDILFLGMFGERQQAHIVRKMTKEGITEESMQKIGSVLSLMFHDKWQTLTELMIEGIPTDSYKMTTTETVTDVGNATHTINNERTSTDVDKVSGYNTDEFVNDTTRENIGNEVASNVGSTDNQKTLSKTVSGHMGNAITDKISSIEFAKREVILETVMQDVVTTIGMLVY